MAQRDGEVGPAKPKLTPGDLKEISILAVDHGERRIGLAVKPEGSEAVLPLAVIEGQPEEAAMGAIRRIIEERGVGIVVVGLPIHPDGSQAQRVKRFTRRLRKGVRGVRWRFTDESLTTAAAEDLRAAVDGKKKKPIDDEAAALILETFLKSLQE